MGVKYLDKEYTAESASSGTLSDESDFKEIEYLDTNQPYADEVDNEFPDIIVIN